MCPAPALVIAIALLLAACAEPRTACLTRADAPLRALDAEIAEADRALVLGYRVASGSRVTAGMRVCANNSPVTLCIGGERPIAERHLPVDAATERARLRALHARRDTVAAEAKLAVAACPAS